MLKVTIIEEPNVSLIFKWTITKFVVVLINFSLHRFSIISPILSEIPLKRAPSLQDEFFQEIIAKLEQLAVTSCAVENVHVSVVKVILVVIVTGLPLGCSAPTWRKRISNLLLKFI